MDRKLKRSILGFIISPLVGSAMIFLIVAVEWIIETVLHVDTILVSFPETMIGILIITGVPGMYTLALLMGMPTFYILTKLRLNQWYSYILCGLIWGVLISGVYVIILKGFPVKGLIGLFFSNELIFGMSFLCYWRIAVRE